MPPEGSGGENKSVVVGVSWFAPFMESEQLRSRVTASRSRCRNHFSPLQQRDYHTSRQEPGVGSCWGSGGVLLLVVGELWKGLVVGRVVGVRVLADPFVVAPPGGTSIRTRLRVTDAEHGLLVEVGDLLAGLRNRDLARLLE